MAPEAFEKPVRPPCQRDLEEHVECCPVDGMNPAWPLFSQLKRTTYNRIAIQHCRIATLYNSIPVHTFSYVYTEIDTHTHRHIYIYIYILYIYICIYRTWRETRSDRELVETTDLRRLVVLRREHTKHE